MLATTIEDYARWLEERVPACGQFHATALGIARDLMPAYGAREDWRKLRLLERLSLPDAVHTFMVEWEDDQGQVQLQRGWRVQHANLLGPYKGGLRFQRGLQLDTLRFLALEQTYKGALTGLPLGGAKGGADFDAEGRSPREIMRFCQAFMTRLAPHIGPDRDVPAGDENVGEREIGFLFGQYRRLTGLHVGALTGKGPGYGGSKLRTEATGYGVAYMARAVLARQEQSLEGQRVVISGAGNVALHAAERCLQLGARVLAVSDSRGYCHFTGGLAPEQLGQIKRTKLEEDGHLADCAEAIGADYVPGGEVWEVGCDLALPCATQNEISKAQVEALAAGGCRLLVEGANGPVEPDSEDALAAADITRIPGKAANAGGVAVSNFELAQQEGRLPWTRETLDERLQQVMQAIHARCVAFGGGEDGQVDYVAGANRAAFDRLARALQAQGVG